MSNRSSNDASGTSVTSGFDTKDGLCSPGFNRSDDQRQKSGPEQSPQSDTLFGTFDSAEFGMDVKMKNPLYLVASSDSVIRYAKAQRDEELPPTPPVFRQARAGVHSQRPSIDESDKHVLEAFGSGSGGSSAAL